MARPHIYVVARAHGEKEHIAPIVLLIDFRIFQNKENAVAEAGTDHQTCYDAYEEELLGLQGTISL